jgi:outer membrane lipoprotein SlyB
MLNKDMTMETEKKSGIHPLAAGAAIAVIIASAVGVAAMTGNMPGSNAEPAITPQAVVVAPVVVAPPVVTTPRPVARTESAEQRAERERAEFRAAERERAQDRAAERDRDRARDQRRADASQARAPARVICANCGVVEAVNTVQKAGEGGVVGMVGGGVAGAVVGSQIGSGTGRTVAQVAGAAGGAYLGNEIQKKVTASTHYDVVVRLENGGAQTISYPTPPAFAVGNRVRVENGTLVRI